MGPACCLSASLPLALLPARPPARPPVPWTRFCDFFHFLIPTPCSVMLWRRSDNVVFALLLGGAGLVAVGDGVECQVKGILQVGGVCSC